MKCEHGYCHYSEECGEKLVCRYDGEVISKDDKICHKYKDKYIDIGKDVRDMIDGKKYDVNFAKVADVFKHYKSPITQISGEITSELIKYNEDHLLTAVRQEIGYQVDKDELLKALQYDRDQYKKGYEDAVTEILDKIYEMFADVQCMDCTGYDVYCDIKNEIAGEK